MKILRIPFPFHPSRKRRELPRFRETIRNLDFRRKRNKLGIKRIYVYTCGHCSPVTHLLHGKTVTYIFVNTKCIKCEGKWIGLI